MLRPTAVSPRARGPGPLRRAGGRLAGGRFAGARLAGGRLADVERVAGVERADVRPEPEEEARLRVGALDRLAIPREYP